MIQILNNKVIYKLTYCIYVSNMFIDDKMSDYLRLMWAIQIIGYKIKYKRIRYLNDII